MPAPGADQGQPRQKGRHRHGRRPLDRTNLAKQEVVIQPSEVLAAPHLYRCIGEERAERLAYRPASYFRLVTIRPKWVRIEEEGRLSVG